jgi:hypothetical protein
MRDVHSVDSRPWNLSSEAELVRFRDLLLDDRRALPFLLLTQPNQGKLGIPTAPFLLNADELARKACGIAHIVTLPTDLGFRWTVPRG